MVRTTKRVLMLAVLGGITLAMTGCPLGPTFEIWVINTSDQAVVANVRVSSMSSDAVVEFPEDLPANTARVISDIDATPFEGGGIVIDIDGDAGDGIFEESATVSIESALMSGDTYPIVVSGDNVLTYNAEYVPLEAASKGLLVLRKDLAAQ